MPGCVHGLGPDPFDLVPADLRLTEMAEPVFAEEEEQEEAPGFDAWRVVNMAENNRFIRTAH